MEYNGKLYGKFRNKYFDTGKTSKDYDLLEKQNKKMLEEIQDTIDDLTLLKSAILHASKTNNKLESMVEVIQNWIDRKEQLINEATEL